MRNILLISLFFFNIIFFGCRPQKETISNPLGINENLKETQYFRLFTDATKHALFGNFQSAAQMYQACIELYPDRAAPYYQMSSIYIRSQNPSSAVDFAERAWKLDSSNVWYAVNLANVYQYLGFLDSAVVMLKKTLALKPDDEIRYNLAMLYTQRKDFDEAEKLLNVLEERNPGTREILMMRHNIYNEKRNYDSAIYQLELITEYFPDDINNYGILAEYLAEVGKREYARKLYIDMLKKDSLNGITMISFAEFYLQESLADSAFYLYNKAFRNSDLIYSDKINILINQVSNKDFVKLYSDRILQLLDIIKRQDRDYNYYTLKADVHLSLEEYPEAKIYLDSALIYEKSNYQLWEQALLLNSFLLNHNDVLEIADECITYFRDKPSVLMFKAYAEKGLNNQDSAINTALKILKMMPDEPVMLQSYMLLAECYREKSQYDISDNYFEKILSIDPDNLGVRNNYAYYLSLREINLSKAKELSKMTVEKEPENATYLDTYGWILFKMGKFNEAKEYIEKAIRNGAFNNAEVIDHYGDIMEALGRCTEAIEAYERVKTLDPLIFDNKKLESVRTNCDQ